MRRDLLLLLPLLLALSSCATQQPAPEPTIGWEQRRERLLLLRNWRASGKLAFFTAERSETASLVWAQRGEVSELQLSGPVGMGATSIRSDGRQLEIQRGDSTQRQDLTGEAIPLAGSDWDLPVRELPFWLRGVPAPDSNPTNLVLKAELADSFEQAGWRVCYQARDLFSGYLLPTRLEVERNGTRARLVIRTWHLDVVP